jgi:fructokinase
MRIGIDLGGTKIEGIVLDDSGETVARRRVASPQGRYPATLDAIVALVLDLERAAGRPGSVGVGIPGALSPATGRIKNANSTWLIGEALDRDLARRLGRPVRLENDANCFALSEATDGAAAGARLVFGATLGTGVGGAIVVDGRPLVGANAIAGEWGHNPLGVDPEDGPPLTCGCGRTGCVETWLNGSALARDHGNLGGEALAAPDVARLAEAGDTVAGRALGRYQRRLAMALGQIVNILDPEVIVLGGSVATMASLYTMVPRLWGAFTVAAAPRTRLVPARFGPDSGLRGAAWLAGPS